MGILCSTWDISIRRDVYQERNPGVKRDLSVSWTGASNQEAVAVVLQLVLSVTAIIPWYA